MTLSKIDWVEIQSLVDKFAKLGKKPGKISEPSEWATIRHALQRLLVDEEWEDIIRLRLILKPLFGRDTMSGLAVLQELDNAAIKAARQVGDIAELAHFLGARGHNLHRQGYHREAIEVFEESHELYKKVGKSFHSLKSYYMTSLCYRALGDRAQARQIVTEVLQQVEEDNPWRGNPLQVMAWLAQDDGQLDEAERLLREALSLQEQGQNSDILVAGTLTDLGEVIGLQGRVAEAKTMFHRSLNILTKHEGQYDRQEARTKFKFAQLLMYHNEYQDGLKFLNEADDQIRGYGHYYDLLWQIELARAFIFLRQRNISGMIRKLRGVFYYRQKLGLSKIRLVWQILTRVIGMIKYRFIKYVNN